MRILFVCLGNICRSPTAEGVFKAKVAEAGLEAVFEADSAGTGDWHLGQAPDRRAQAACRAHGVDIARHRARQVRRQDFEDFDLILGCDKENVRDLIDIAPVACRHKVKGLVAYAPDCGYNEVPDPYYGGPEGFETVFKLCEAAAEGILRQHA